MDEDRFRKKADFRLYCSVHPQQELLFSGKMSRVGASSAYEINIGISDHPCELCKAEADKIKNAVSTLIKSTTN